MKFVKLFSILALVFTFLNAEIISQSGSKGGFDVKLTTEKSLVVGQNIFFIELEKDGETVTDAKVKAKFYMPEMPGMPYMEFEDNAQLVDGKYKLNINLSMGGTWQYQIKFKQGNGKVQTLRGSVNL